MVKGKKRGDLYKTGEEEEAGRERRMDTRQEPLPLLRLDEKGACVRTRLDAWMDGLEGDELGRPYAEKTILSDVGKPRLLVRLFSLSSNTLLQTMPNRMEEGKRKANEWEWDSFLLSWKTALQQSSSLADREGGEEEEDCVAYLVEGEGGRMEGRSLNGIPLNPYLRTLLPLSSCRGGEGRRTSLLGAVLPAPGGSFVLVSFGEKRTDLCVPLWETSFQTNI